MINSILPVYNPINLNCIDSQPRYVVHHQGFWHKGIQAHLIRDLSETNDFEIFIQERSNNVDISGYKLDQSLATQMIIEDKLDEEKTLNRGLSKELKISEYSSMHIPLNLRIVKKYQEYPNTLNREILSLFLVKSYQKPQWHHCNKINNGFWVSWKKFKCDIKKQPSIYTKTAQMYMINSEISEFIESKSIGFLKNKIDISKPSKIFFGSFPAMKLPQFMDFKSEKELENFIS